LTPSRGANNLSYVFKKLVPASFPKTKLMFPEAIIQSWDVLAKLAFAGFFGDGFERDARGSVSELCMN